MDELNSNGSENYTKRKAIPRGRPIQSKAKLSLTLSPSPTLLCGGQSNGVYGHE